MAVEAAKIAANLQSSGPRQHYFFIIIIITITEGAYWTEHDLPT